MAVVIRCSPVVATRGELFDLFPCLRYFLVFVDGNRSEASRKWLIVSDNVNKRPIYFVDCCWWWRGVVTSLPTLLAIDFSLIISDDRLEFPRNKKNNADGIIQHHFSAKGGERIHSIDLFTATRLFSFSANWGVLYFI